MSKMPEFMRDWKPQDNTTQYLQGRADQRRSDRIVALACLIAVVLYIVFVER